MSNLVILKGVFLLLFGCFANNIFLELVIKVDPACGPSLTLCQFLFIVVTLLPSNVNKQRVIPLWFYIISTAMFFIVSYLNNLAFNFHISQPVHMVCSNFVNNLISEGGKVKFTCSQFYCWTLVFQVKIRSLTTVFCPSCDCGNFDNAECRGWFQGKTESSIATNGFRLFWYAITVLFDLGPRCWLRRRRVDTKLGRGIGAA